MKNNKNINIWNQRARNSIVDEFIECVLLLFYIMARMFIAFEKVKICIIFFLFVFHCTHHFSVFTEPRLQEPSTNS